MTLSWLRYRYGKAIEMAQYDDDFLSGDEAKKRLAVKRLTRQMELEIRQMTVNAPDW